MTSQLRPRQWPHFMKRYSKNNVYKSTNILGILYDMVEVTDFHPFLNAPFDKRVLAGIDVATVSEKHLQAARHLKGDYDEAMRRIMAQHEIQTEFEVWTTFVLYHSRITKDYSFHEEIGRLAFALKERFQQACYEAAGGKENIQSFVAAMYHVTAEETASTMQMLHDQRVGDVEESKIPKQELPFISFPWLFPKELGQLAKRTGGSTAHGIDVRQGEQQHRTTRRTTTANVNHEVETVEGVTQEGDLLKLFDDKDALPVDHGNAATVENGINLPHDKTEESRMTLPRAENGLLPSTTMDPNISMLYLENKDTAINHSLLQKESSSLAESVLADRNIAIETLNPSPQEATQSVAAALGNRDTAIEQFNHSLLQKESRPLAATALDNRDTAIEPLTSLEAPQRARSIAKLIPIQDSPQTEDAKLLSELVPEKETIRNESFLVDDGPDKDNAREQGRKTISQAGILNWADIDGDEELSAQEAEMLASTTPNAQSVSSEEEIEVEIDDEPSKLGMLAKLVNV